MSSSSVQDGSQSCTPESAEVLINRKIACIIESAFQETAEEQKPKTSDEDEWEPPTSSTTKDVHSNFSESSQSSLTTSKDDTQRSFSSFECQSVSKTTTITEKESCDTDSKQEAPVSSKSYVGDKVKIKQSGEEGASTAIASSPVVHRGPKKWFLATFRNSVDVGDDNSSNNGDCSSQSASQTLPSSEPSGSQESVTRRCDESSDSPDGNGGANKNETQSANNSSEAQAAPSSSGDDDNSKPSKSSADSDAKSKNKADKGDGEGMINLRKCINRILDAQIIRKCLLEPDEASVPKLVDLDPSIFTDSTPTTYPLDNLAALTSSVKSQGQYRGNQGDSASETKRQLTDFSAEIGRAPPSLITHVPTRTVKVEDSPKSTTSPGKRVQPMSPRQAGVSDAKKRALPLSSTQSRRNTPPTLPIAPMPRVSSADQSGEEWKMTPTNTRVPICEARNPERNIPSSLDMHPPYASYPPNPAYVPGQLKLSEQAPAHLAQTKLHPAFPAEANLRATYSPEAPGGTLYLGSRYMGQRAVPAVQLTPRIIDSHTRIPSAPLPEATPYVSPGAPAKIYPTQVSSLPEPSWTPKSTATPFNDFTGIATFSPKTVGTATPIVIQSHDTQERRLSVQEHAALAASQEQAMKTSHVPMFITVGTQAQLIYSATDSMGQAAVVAGKPVIPYGPGVIPYAVPASGAVAFNPVSPYPAQVQYTPSVNQYATLAGVSSVPPVAVKPRASPGPEMHALQMASKPQYIETSSLHKPTHVHLNEMPHVVGTHVAGPPPPSPPVTPHELTYSVDSNKSKDEPLDLSGTTSEDGDGPLNLTVRSKVLKIDPSFESESQQAFLYKEKMMPEAAYISRTEQHERSGSSSQMPEWRERSGSYDRQREWRELRPGSRSEWTTHAEVRAQVNESSERSASIGSLRETRDHTSTRATDIEWRENPASLGRPVEYRQRVSQHGRAEWEEQQMSGGHAGRSAIYKGQSDRRSDKPAIDSSLYASSPMPYNPSRLYVDHSGGSTQLYRDIIHSPGSRSYNLDASRVSREAVSQHHLIERNHSAISSQLKSSNYPVSKSGSYTAMSPVGYRTPESYAMLQQAAQNSPQLSPQRLQGHSHKMSATVSPGDEGVYKCNLCHQTFGSLNHLRKHLHRVHGLDPPMEHVQYQKGVMVEGTPESVEHSTRLVHQRSETVMPYQMHTDISKGGPQNPIIDETGKQTPLSGKQQVLRTPPAQAIVPVKNSPVANQSSNLVCTRCNLEFSTRDWGAFKRHMRSHDSSLACCNACQMFFPNQEKKQEHLHRYHPRCTFCKHCGMSFQELVLLNKHMQDNHAPGQHHSRLFCPYCARAFDNERHWQLHISEHDKYIRGETSMGMVRRASPDSTNNLDEFGSGDQGGNGKGESLGSHRVQQLPEASGSSVGVDRLVESQHIPIFNLQVRTSEAEQYKGVSLLDIVKKKIEEASHVLEQEETLKPECLVFQRLEKDEKWKTQHPPVEPKKECTNPEQMRPSGESIIRAQSLPGQHSVSQISEGSLHTSKMPSVRPRRTAEEALNRLVEKALIETIEMERKAQSVAALDHPGVDGDSENKSNSERRRLTKEKSEIIVDVPKEEDCKDRLPLPETESGSELPTDDFVSVNQVIKTETPTGAQSSYGSSIDVNVYDEVDDNLSNDAPELTRALDVSPGENEANAQDPPQLVPCHAISEPSDVCDSQSTASATKDFKSKAQTDVMKFAMDESEICDVQSNSDVDKGSVLSELSVQKSGESSAEQDVCGDVDSQETSSSDDNMMPLLEQYKVEESHSFYTSEQSTPGDHTLELTPLMSRESNPSISESTATTAPYLVGKKRWLAVAKDVQQVETASPEPPKKVKLCHVPLEDICQNPDYADVVERKTVKLDSDSENDTGDSVVAGTSSVEAEDLDTDSRDARMSPPTSQESAQFTESEDAA